MKIKDFKPGDEVWITLSCNCTPSLNLITDKISSNGIAWVVMSYHGREFNFPMNSDVFKDEAEALKICSEKAIISIQEDISWLNEHRETFDSVVYSLNDNSNNLNNMSKRLKELESKKDDS